MSSGRNGSACELCHRRKIRCDMHTGLFPCSHCRNVNQQCVPHQRKRKHDNFPPSSAPKRLNIHPAVSSPVSRLSRSGTMQLSEFSVPQTSLGSVENETSPGSYLGRAEYVNGTVPIDEEDAKKYSSGQVMALPEEDSRYLIHLQAFDVPARSTHDSLISSFMNQCHPWMPIVESHELRPSESFRPSLLLLNSIFVAGSRVSLASDAQASGQMFYRRAKALYHLGYEKVPMTVVRSICLLLWFNNSGPEHISLDASSFWLHMGVALAHQIGLHREPSRKLPDAKLRRRLWWTLFIRDCQIATSHGRPRAINPEDCDVRPLTLDDFPAVGFDAMLFLAYLEICSILADLTEALVRGTLGRVRLLGIQSRLLSWIRDLPDPLRLCDKNTGVLLSYNLKSRQLNAMFFTAIMLLFRPTSPANMPSSAAILASSFSAGIFEDFLARGELGFLAPVFNFHLMTAAYAQLACYKYPVLWAKTEAELDTINKCLVEMAKRYPTAVGAQRIIKAVFRAVSAQERHEQPFNLVPEPDQLNYFDFLGPELCSKWTLVLPVRHTPSLEVQTGGQLTPAHTRIGPAQMPSTLPEANRPFTPSSILPPSANGNPHSTPGFSEVLQDVSDPFNVTSVAFTAVGNWMLGGWMADLDCMAGDFEA
ncbi:hypothetical protein K469DRAFT_665282 [Zopfia rhizophila CBS 207.26]|uniref:Zn(2)-C6 fungal-type domain-containing protein n=1 Tax=Zopfia rhizophila CBS 207.26 TaxID=1314779 RepID=A0A6A6E113_9PEZI|nr:hypothetical protein K469DRAFT_665282 [Zopfia rhizophila CBS 207.26]